MSSSSAATNNKSSSSNSNNNKDSVLALYHQQGVEELFDEYAATFDEHLQNKLRYQVPKLLYELWQKHARIEIDSTIVEHEKSQLPLQRRFKCLDLGCGTGLSGSAFASDCCYLEGVDLSRKMCRQAQKKNIYNHVVHSSLLSHLIKSKASSFDLMISVDVFIYVLDLGAILTQAARVLTPGGWLVFSTERLTVNDDDGCAPTSPPPDFARCTETERFAHRRQYVLDIAAATLQLNSVAVEGVVLRMEEGRPVHGDLFLFQKQEQFATIQKDSENQT